MTENGRAEEASLAEAQEPDRLSDEEVLAFLPAAIAQIDAVAVAFDEAAGIEAGVAARLNACSSAIEAAVAESRLTLRECSTSA